MPTLTGRWLYVGGSGPENYTRIQDAIDNASDGDTIFVYSGMYYEYVVVNKTIDLIGEDKNTTVIDGGSAEEAVVYVPSVGVTISGFTMQNGGCGICLGFSSSNNTIICNNINSNEFYGISLCLSSNNTIKDNNISNNYCGILLSSSSNNNTVMGNNASNNGAGIVLGFSSNNTVIGNNANSNIYYGISLEFSNNSFITSNNAFNNGRGIKLSSSNNNTIMDNNVNSNNWYGIEISSSSNNNHLYHNNLMNNAQNAYDECVNEWDNGYSGNYWDSYNGDDVFWGLNQDRNGSDGVGDVPYNIPGRNNTDRYPLMFPYGWPYEPLFLGYIDMVFEKEDLHSSGFHGIGVMYSKFIQVNTSIDELHLKFVVYITIEMNYSLLCPFVLSPLVSFGMQVNNYTDYSWDIMKLKHHGRWIWYENISQEIIVYPKEYKKGDQLLINFNLSTIHVPGLNIPDNRELWEKLLRFIYNIPMLNRFLLINWILPMLAPYNLFFKNVPAVLICFQ